jgi:hypothetical protein
MPAIRLHLSQSSWQQGIAHDVSFTSQTIAQGSFPTDVQFKEPIIISVLMGSGKKDSCPTKSDLTDQVVNVMLEYELFNSVFDPVTGDTLRTRLGSKRFGTRVRVLRVQ